ncbi:MAG: efflux RND transporter periplasmic adaptor subunit [Endozoicomonas sp.]
MEATQEIDSQSVSTQEPTYDLSHPLFKLLQFEKEIRGATNKNQLKYVIANRLRRLIDFQHAVLLRTGHGVRTSVVAVSDVSSIDKNSPFVRWMKSVGVEQMKSLDSEASFEIRDLSLTDLSPRLQKGWKEWSCENSLWVPLKSPAGRLQAVLWLVRDKPFSDYEKVLIQHLSETVAHAWMVYHPKPLQWRKLVRKNIVYGLLLTALVSTFFIPIRKSVLAPAEVVSEFPAAVTAPFDAVVREILVKPNQFVRPGDKLVRLEDTDLRNNYELAREELAIAQVELRKLRQGAFFDPQAKASLAELEAQVDLKRAQLNYARELVGQTTISASQSGVAIFRNENDWQGRPIYQGEKVLYLANPEEVQLQIHLPIRDALVLDEGADIRLFLDVKPLEPLNAELVNASYDAEATPDGVLAYLVKAKLKPGEEIPRIGLRGTAKMYGDETSLFMYLFRRPLATVRQWLGL